MTYILPGQMLAFICRILLFITSQGRLLKGKTNWPLADGVFVIV